MPEGNVDSLQIDTEGADALVVSLFPFERIKPTIVSWEVHHLSLRKREECLALQAGDGYRFAPSGSQAVGICWPSVRLARSHDNLFP